MQMFAQINNKNKSWVVSATLLLATLCTVFFMAFSPITTPKAHASVAEFGEWIGGGIINAGTAVYNTPKHLGEFFLDPIGKGKEVIADGAEKAVDGILGEIFEQIGRLLFWISSQFLGVASWLLDASIIQSLDSGLISRITAIDEGWGLVRDVCNMFFIFILLYISIATILQATTFNWKKTLGNLIIAALLINFSLFFTKVIIDVSNMFALTFYNSMKTEVNSVDHYGPSVILKEGLGLKTTLDDLDEKKAVGDKSIEFNNMKRGIIWVFGAIFNMIAGFVFFAGAFIFIKRTIAFIFLMIFSPIGFVGFVLPATKKFSNMWWSALTENAVIAPAFLFMLYLVCNIIRSGNLVDINQTDKSSLAVAFLGDSDHFVIILQFIILIGLIWGALVIAQNVSSATASSSIRFAGRMTGGMLAGTAIAGRQVGGRVGRAVSESDLVKRGATSRSGIIRAGSRMALKGGDAAAKSSWDVRNTKAGDAAISGTLNYASELGKTGAINVGAGRDRGKGGVVGARAAEDKKIAHDRQNLGNILAKDSEGRIRMTERTAMKEEQVMKKNKKTGKMVATGKTKMVPKKDDDGKNIKETVTTRKAYVDQLREQTKPAESFKYQRYGIRDRQAIKEGIKLAEKGDKETKESLMEEKTLALENELKGAKDATERAEIVSNIGGNDLVNIDPKVISGKDVAPHLSARQARKVIEDKRTNLSDKNFEEWQKNLEEKVRDINTVGAEKEKAEGALSYIKSGASYVKKEGSVPEKSASETIGSTDQHGNNININRGDQDSTSANYISDGS